MKNLKTNMIAIIANFFFLITCLPVSIMAETDPSNLQNQNTPNIQPAPSILPPPQVVQPEPSAPAIEPSREFDNRFWSRVIEHQRQPWLLRLLKDLEFLIPTPNFSQAFAVLVIAFVIGGTGGFFSAFQTLRTPEQVQAQRISVQYLSGFGEFKGVPSTSVAGTYLRTTEERKVS